MALNESFNSSFNGRVVAAYPGMPVAARRRVHRPRRYIQLLVPQLPVRATRWIGDFDGDGYDDLFCHRHISGGDHGVDYANGRSSEYFGQEWSRDANWCGSETQRPYGDVRWPF
jgi:hypothetical protein